MKKVSVEGVCWPLVHAYNCTRNDTTGYTPYELMFGRQPRLPVDLAFGLPIDNPMKSHSQYMQDLRTLHRDLLLPCGFLQACKPERKKVFKRPRTRASPNIHESESF